MTTISAMIGAAFTSKIELRVLPPCMNPFTDSKIFFEVNKKGTRASGKQVMLDATVAKEGFLTRNTSSTGHIWMQYSLGDTFNKRTNQSKLQNVLHARRLNNKLNGISYSGECFAMITYLKTRQHLHRTCLSSNENIRCVILYCRAYLSCCKIGALQMREANIEKTLVY